MNTFWSVPIPLLFRQLNSGEAGLTGAEAKKRLKEYAPKKTLSSTKKDIKLFLTQFKSPLVLILIGAVVLALFLGDYVNSTIVLIIIISSSMLSFWQERNAGRAIEKLQSMVRITAAVKRDGIVSNISLAEVVPGDIIMVNAGDIIPGDGRLISCNDLHINEAALTGESFPREKSIVDVDENAPLTGRANSVFKGTSVMNGTGTVLIVAIGSATVFGKVASSLSNNIPLTAFEKGTKQLGYLLLQLTLTFSIVILLLNLYMDKPVMDSALFALALAVGITPELLPAIITIALSTGATRLAQKKVIVKKLNAIHNLGSVDTFCIDKTGTLTEGAVKLYKAIDVSGQENDKILRYAIFNATFETGFSNPIDQALRAMQSDLAGVTKVDEIPYDFFRKRLSIIVSTEEKQIMITKGSVNSIVKICNRVEIDGEIKPLDDFTTMMDHALNDFGAQGFRAIGICYKEVDSKKVFEKEDEGDMIFLGFILLYDPPKQNVETSLKKLNKAGVEIKLITGDNARVAEFLGARIGLNTTTIITGQELRTMSDEALMFQTGQVFIFAETEPDQKERIVRMLQKSGRTVAFMGDGINDVSALRTADVGISVDSATDVAKDTADIVLLEKSLDVLYDGVIEGRKTFINSLKYIFITTSANFGNMFSVAGASLFLKFLPLLPKQILLINFLTDMPAMTLASDAVESEALRKPRKWDNRMIRNFMLVFGFQSTFFDFLTFYVLYYVFGSTPEQFRTGWFVECVITELLILLVIRTTRPFYKSRPARSLLFVTLLIACLTVIVLLQPFRSWLGFAYLNLTRVSAIIVIIVLYVISSEVTKSIFFKKHKLTS